MKIERKGFVSELDGNMIANAIRFETEPVDQEHFDWDAVVTVEDVLAYMEWYADKKGLSLCEMFTEEFVEELREVKNWNEDETRM